MERLLARAQERGEAREKIGQSAKVLPFQMTRYHMLLEGQSMNDKQIKELVDEVLLPIYIKTPSNGEFYGKIECIYTKQTRID